MNQTDTTVSTARQCWVYGWASSFCGSVTLNLDSSTVQAWLWLQLNLLYKRSAAPGTALRYILYFSLAYLSSPPLVSYSLSCYDNAWDGGNGFKCVPVRRSLRYFKALYVSPRRLWHLLSPVIMLLIVLLFLENWIQEQVKLELHFLCSLAPSWPLWTALLYRQECWRFIVSSTPAQSHALSCGPLLAHEFCLRREEAKLSHFTFLHWGCGPRD